MNLEPYFTDKKTLVRALHRCRSQGLIRESFFGSSLVVPHMDKAMHNLSFVEKNRTDHRFTDWTIIALYYAVYHAALSLLAYRGFTAKSHIATLLFLINEGLFSQKDMCMVRDLNLTRKDLESYTSLRDARKNASYSTNVLFTPDILHAHRRNAIQFITKIADLVGYSM